jgi:hypothetical protein
MTQRPPATVVKDSQIVNNSPLSSLSDDSILTRTRMLAGAERAATAALIECMAIVDERRLWAGLGFASMFEFSAYGLRLGEAPAFKRIRAARAIRLFPPILPLLRDRRLTLEAAAMLHPHLESPNISTLVTKACGLRIKALEAMLSDLRPAQPARDVVRFTGTQGVPAKPLSHEATPARSSTLPFLAAAETRPPQQEDRPQGEMKPISEPERAKLVRISFTADEDFYRLLEKARASLRHKYPDGRLEGVLRDALVLLIERRDPVLRWRTRRKPRAQNMS